MKHTKVIIIGSGPSGITAALYLYRSNIPFVLLEKYMIGGKLSTTSFIENYPGFNKEDGVEFALKLQKQLDYNNIPVNYDEVINIDKFDNTFIVKCLTETYECEYVILASGTKEKRLHLPNEDKFIGRGISFCAICDGTLYRNREVAVVGGGNSALEETLYLASIVKKVYLIHRKNDFKGQDILLERIKKLHNVDILTPYNITKYNGENVLESIEITSIDGQITKKIPVQCLFMYIGLEPNNEFLKMKINNQAGFVVTDELMETSILNLYAVGDIRFKPLRQIVTATSDGAIAAIAIQNKIKKR